MTTNITPIEAIREILALPKPCTTHCVDCQMGQDIDDECYPNKVRSIATQTLAQKECDVKDEQILYGSRLAGKNIQRAYQLVDWMAKNKGCKSYAILTLDKLKQLHSQQKTFNDICNYGNPNTNYENCCYINKPPTSCNDCDRNNKNRKTFTVEEIREILYKHCKENGMILDDYKSIFAEFEKAVG